MMLETAATLLYRLGGLVGPDRVAMSACFAVEEEAGRRASTFFARERFKVICGFQSFSQRTI